MRILKFAAVFMITAIVLFGFVIGFNWSTFKVFLDNRDALAEGTEWIMKTSSLKGLSEFLGENPQFGSISSVVITKPDSTLHFGSDERRTMGTTSNLFILLGFAIEFERGHLNPESDVNWQDISGYQLPDVDESVHLNAYRIAQKRGWLSDDQTISLQHALLLLAETNDLALSDFLWWQLRDDIWSELQEILNLNETDMPLPYSGLYLSVSPYFQESSVSNLILRFENSSSQSWREFVIHTSENFVNDPQYREEVLQYMKKNRLGNTFMEERDALKLFPSTTSREMTRLLQELAELNVVSPSVSEYVLNILRWPMRNQPGIEQDFLDYGALYDNRLGLMAGFDFGTSSYTGDTTVQAIYMDRLPVGFWFHASGGHMHQDFMQRLIFDPAFIDQIYDVTGN